MRYQIEERLIKFSVSIINLCRDLNNEYVSQHLASQIIRSSTSSALNYGEAQGAESQNDFIHKTSIVLKELRETYVSLKIINQSGIVKSSKNEDDLLKECNELVSIFHKTVKTAKANRR